MKKTMRAAVLYAGEDLRLEEVPVPAIGPEEVLIEVKACALCGSDLHAYLGRHPRIRFPRIMGHEFAGVIAQKGEKVTGWEIGQRAACDVDLPCLQCDLCRQGRRNLCVNIRTQGFDSDGAYAEYVKVPQRNLYTMPETMTYDQATLAQTLGVAYNGVKRRGEVKVMERVLILGCGPIGLCAVAVAKASGAKVFAVDTLDYRLEVARGIGAEQVFNSEKGDLIKAALEWTRGRGVDKVIEAVGGVQDVTMTQATQVVKRGGLIVVIGTYGTNRATLRMAEFKDRELELRGARSYIDAFADCIELVGSGKLGLERMITHHLKLEEVEKGLKMMNAKAENVLKVVISP